MTERSEKAVQRLDGAYHWALIAAEREATAWSARGGKTNGVSPLVAGDPMSAELHASLAATVAAAASAEALYLERLGQLRAAPNRGARWVVPEVEAAHQRRSGRGVAKWEAVAWTLDFVGILPQSDQDDWHRRLEHLFSERNAAIHLNTDWEILQPATPVDAFIRFGAQAATKAVDVALDLLDATGQYVLEPLRSSRP